jgi:molybdopterin converting factor small subunit
MDLLPSELDAKIQEQEQSLAAAQQEVEDALQKLQKDYAEARRRKARWLEMEDVDDVYGKYTWIHHETSRYPIFNQTSALVADGSEIIDHSLGGEGQRFHKASARKSPTSCLKFVEKSSRSTAIPQNCCKNKPVPRVNNRAVKDGAELKK